MLASSTERTAVEPNMDLGSPSWGVTWPWCGARHLAKSRRTGQVGWHLAHSGLPCVAQGVCHAVPWRAIHVDCHVSGSP